MARALADIMTELNSAYAPQRDLYNKQLSEVDPQLEAEQKGLQAQKQDSFQQITDQANRRGLFYSGLPIAEEQRYTGQQFLPAVANLRAKYTQQRFGLQDALAKILQDQNTQAQGIHQTELDREEKQRQFEAQLAAQREAEAAAAAQRASAASGQASFGGISTSPQTNPNRGVLGASTTLRQRWQQEANSGDWEAQTLLNFVGDDNRFDGQVNNQDEYNILKKYGVQGNYSVRGGASPASIYVTGTRQPSIYGALGGL